MEIAIRRRAGITGVLLLLCAVTMLFSALTSAMLVRRGLGEDWAGFAPPPLIWWNTAAIAASSLALALGRRGWAIGLGCLFAIGQMALWRALGVSLAASPAAAFFYVFTALHAAHVACGIPALARWGGPASRIYWHFLTGLWVYLLVLVLTLC